MSIFAAGASQISARRVPRSAIAISCPEMPPSLFALCRRGRRRRNDAEARRRRIFALYCRAMGDRPVQERHRAMRAILAIALLCTAFSVVGQGAGFQRSPRRKTIAHGKALADRRRLRELPYRRSGKTVRRGKAHRHPVRRDLFAQSDAGSRNRAGRAGATRISVRALRYGVAPDGSRYYPAFPYPYFTKVTRQDVAGDPRLSRDAHARSATRSRRRNCAGR